MYKLKLIFIIKKLNLLYLANHIFYYYIITTLNKLVIAI